jgi:hypothetical protein
MNRTNRTDQVLAALRGTAPSPVAPSEEVTGALKEKAVRFTFDVDRHQHRFIRQFVLDEQTTASAATRALWTLVQADNALAERLRGILSANSSERRRG